MSKYNKSKRNYIDDMVDVFGYDYVIGYCLCSEYDLRSRIEREEDEVQIAKLKKMANRYEINAERLIGERMNNGL